MQQGVVAVINLNVTIERLRKGRGQNWYASPELLQRLGLRKGDSIRIEFGSFRRAATLTPRLGVGGHVLYIPASESLPFPTFRSYFAKWDKDANTLKLGPLVGILTAASSVPGKPFAGRLHFFREIVQYAYSMGALAFCFTPEGLDLAKQQCTGYVYSHGNWKGVRLPLPDVVYNRVPAREFERTQAVQRAKCSLESAGIPYFNPSFLNKWHLYKIFSSHEHLSRYLPETKQLNSLSDLTSFLQKYDAVYLKPIHGFAGRGIMKVSRSRTGSLLLEYRQNGVNHKRHYRTVGSLLQAVRQLMRGRQYVVQQGLKLAVCGGRMFDLRVLTQRDRHGEWRLIGWGCRVAGQGGITTHVPNGGSIAPFDVVAKATFGDQWHQVQQRVKQLALMVPPCIEAHYQRQFGIISMDIGIDRKGFPWLFEANAKPMEFDEKDTQSSSVTALIHYCRWLAGLNGKEG